MIFPSTIIVSSDSNLLSEKINELCQKLKNIVSPNNPDVFNVGLQSGWGIDTIRGVNSFFSKKPISHQNKIVLIQDAQNLQTEAQNALLKNLEEPGKNNYIFLTTNNSSSLLPTILSRCKIIKISSSSILISEKLLKITGNSPSDLLTSEKIAQNKEDVLPFLEKQLILFQKKLLQDPSEKNNRQIQKIIKATQMIKFNVDPKSALDYVMLA